ERFLGKSQAYVLKLKQPLVLLQQGVLRFRQNLDQRRFVQIVHHAGNRQAAHKFRNQSVANQIAGLHLLEQFRVPPLRRRRHGVRVESERAAPGALLDDFFQADKRPAANEQDIRRIHRREFLVWMLAPALGRHIGHGTFQNLQQRLLHAFAGNVAGNRRVLILLGDLVDLVDVNDALLRLLHVAVGGLQQLQNNVLDVLANVARFGQRRRVHDGKRHFQHPRKGLRQQRLARARRPNQQNIGLAQFHFARLLVQENPFVVVVDRHGELLLRAVLPDDVAIQEPLDFRRPRKLPRGSGGLLALLVFQNGLANSHAFVADVRARIVRRRADQLFHLLLGFVAEGAAQWLIWVKFFHRFGGLSSAGLLRSF